MKEKTSIADRYLLQHFYHSCAIANRHSLQCTGIDNLEVDYSWIDVILSGENKCGKCKHIADHQGFYYGKGEYSSSFQRQEFVSVMNIRSQEEFEQVCKQINSAVKGIILRGRMTDVSPLARFSRLEFVCLDVSGINKLWDMSCNPGLSILTVYTNRRLTTLDGLEGANNLECIQLLTATSEVSTIKVQSFFPVAKLTGLKEVIISGTEPLDHNIDHLIDLPALEYLWISPNLYPMESYAKFEARKFKLADEYGIYDETSCGDIFPYGKGKRIMTSQEQKKRFLTEYHSLMKLFE